MTTDWDTLLSHANEADATDLIDRQLVHRHSAGEVFVTCAVRENDRRWRCGVRFPQTNARMRSATTMPTLLMVEAARQAGIAISHLGFGVTLDHRHLLDRVAMAWITPPPTLSPLVPFEAELDVNITGTQYRRGAVSGLQFDGSWLVAGLPVAIGRAALRCLLPAHYRAIRKSISVRRLAPSTDTAARDTPRPSEMTSVDWDMGDPLIFDHDVDHVPGMALIDSMLRAIPGAASVSMEFHRFAETDTPVELRMQGDGDEHVFEFFQLEIPVATGRTISATRGLMS